MCVHTYVLLTGRNQSIDHMSRRDNGRDRTTETSDQTTTGRVKQICQQFLENSDSGLAHRLQEEEYAVHFDRNRAHRQESRLGVQEARHVEEEEKQAFIAKQYDFHRQKQKTEEDDTALARQLQEETKISTSPSNQRIYHSYQRSSSKQNVYESMPRETTYEDTSCDEQLARILQEEEEFASSSTRYSHLKSAFV